MSPPNVVVTQTDEPKVVITQIDEFHVQVAAVGLQGPMREDALLQADLDAHTEAEIAAREAAIAAEAAARAAAIAQEAADRAAAIAAHAADTTDIHGIADSAALIVEGDPRLSNERVPPDGSVTEAKLAFDPATQAELDAEAAARTNADAAHAAQTTDAHGGIVANTDPRLTDERVPTDGSVTITKLAFDPATQAELDAETSARQAADALLIPLAEKGAALGVAPLNADGKIADNYFGPYPITRPFPVTSEAEMLALTAEVGDIAIRSDNSRSYVLGGTGDPTILDNWKELLSPTVVGGGVTSVDGRTGAVDLTDRYTALSHASQTTDAHGGIVATTDPRLSDQRVPTDGSVTNAKVAANAAIAQAKLALAITNAEVAAEAAIAKSKLGPLAIVNADVDAAAAIAEAKLALASDAAPGTASRRTLGTGAQQAAAGNDSRFPSQSAWSAYTPVLSSTGGTQPSLGSGGVFEQAGRYQQIGKIVFAQVRLAFGSTGAVAGSGNYRISLPVNSTGLTQAAIGHGSIYDSSADLMRQVECVRLGTVIEMWLGHDVAGGAYRVSGTNPWTWAGSDLILLGFVYEAA